METLNYRIKELTKEILETSKGFYETLENLTYAPELPLESSKKILGIINNQQGYIFVALKDNNEIIGTATILIKNKFIHRGSKAAHIEDVVTKKEYEGKGIGNELVKRCIELAKEKRCYKLILNCDKKNISFYEELGFKKHGYEMRKNL